MTIDSRSPALEELDGGGWTTSLGFTNLTDDSITLTARPADATDIGCSLMLDKRELPPAEHTAVTVTVAAGCKVGEDGVDFVVSSTSDTPTPVTFDVTAAPKPATSEPEWDALWAFPAALGALVVAAFVFWLLALDPQPPPPNPPPPPNQRPSLSQPLKYLDAAWSFKDSWVSNVTVVGGLLTGIFGSSEVVTAFLGADADSSVALATVGAAVAIAFVAAGPVVLLATKSKEEDFFTLGGLLAASAVTLAGAFGELWVVYRSGRELDLGGWEDWALYMALAAGAILVVYAFRTLRATVKHGLSKPAAGPASDTIVAAKMVVAALKALPDIDAVGVDHAVQKVADMYPTTGTGPGDAYPRPRKSALL